MSLFFFIRWRRGRGWRWWRWWTRRIGLHLVTSVFVMTLSRNFSFRDKILSLEEIDWAQALTWFAWTYLLLVVGLAGVRICSGDSDGGFWSVIVAHVLQSSLYAESHGLCIRKLFLKARPVKGNMGGWAGMMRCLCFRGLWSLVRDGVSVMWYHHVLACPGRDPLAALEACPSWKGGDNSSSRKSFVFLRRNHPGFHSGYAEGGMSNRIASARSISWLANLYLLQHQELGWLVWVGIGLSVFHFKNQTQICDRPRVTLIRCNIICIWVDVIGKVYNKSSNILE